MQRNLYNSLYPYQSATAILLLAVCLGAVALVLLCRTWNPVKERSYLIPIRKRYDDNLTHEVKKAYAVTQHSRYAKIAIAFVMSGVPLIWMIVNSLKTYIAVEHAKHVVPALGQFLYWALALPGLAFILCVVFAVRVYSTPSMFQKRIVFGASRGNYVLSSMRNPRFAAPRHEAQMRNRTEP